VYDDRVRARGRKSVKGAEPVAVEHDDDTGRQHR
jgi:hypothetical protein